jgi:hypothetical protein
LIISKDAEKAFDKLQHHFYKEREKEVEGFKNDSQDSGLRNGWKRMLFIIAGGGEKADLGVGIEKKKSGLA